MHNIKIAQNPDALASMLSSTDGQGTLLPELERARQDLDALRDKPSTREVLRATEGVLSDLEHIPQTTYTVYREFRRTGERYSYQEPYSLKRERLWAAAVRVFLGEQSLIDAAHDYTWSICEETNWVIPAHESREIDLTAVGTALGLAEMLVLIGDQMADEVVQRVKDEIDGRIFVPYLARHDRLNWFRGGNNWNGVCNGAIGATFLWLEKDVNRLAQGLALVLEGLEVFLATAFEEDGASTEGTGYWQYGLSNCILFAEMLRTRTGGEIDLLGLSRVADIAAYPLHVVLSPGRYASFSDCSPSVDLYPGNLVRLAERTGVDGLKDLMAPPAGLECDGRLPLMVRTMLWWDGDRPEKLVITDSYLPAGEVVRFTTNPESGPQAVLAAKAGHNAENHNQNDVGSFILHVDGEDLLCDPGRGLYSRQYFSELRYENIFANSFGHSLPVIGGELQSPGREYQGKIVEVAPDENRVVIEFGDAYAVEGLESARRELLLDEDENGNATLWLRDAFQFSGEPQEVEEALMTWLDVEVDGAQAILYGERSTVAVTITAPSGVVIVLNELEEASRANAKDGVLKRMTFALPRTAETECEVRVEVTPIG